MECADRREGRRAAGGRGIGGAMGGTFHRAGGYGGLGPPPSFAPPCHPRAAHQPPLSRAGNRRRLKPRLRPCGDCAAWARSHAAGQPSGPARPQRNISNMRRRTAASPLRAGDGADPVRSASPEEAKPLRLIEKKLPSNSHAPASPPSSQIRVVPGRVGPQAHHSMAARPAAAQAHPGVVQGPVSPPTPPAKTRHCRQKEGPPTKSLAIPSLDRVLCTAPPVHSPRRPVGPSRPPRQGPAAVGHDKVLPRRPPSRLSLSQTHLPLVACACARAGSGTTSRRRSTRGSCSGSSARPRTAARGSSPPRPSQSTSTTPQAS